MDKLRISNMKNSKAFRSISVILALVFAITLIPSDLAYAASVQTATSIAVNSVAAENKVQESFAAFKFRAEKSGKHSISYVWSEVEDADGYIIYAAMAEKKFKQVALIEDKAVTSYKLTELTKDTYYKAYIAAYKLEGEERVKLVKSPAVYQTTSGGEHGNPVSVEISELMYTGNSEELCILVGNDRYVNAYVEKEGERENREAEVKLYDSEVRAYSDNPEVAKIVEKENSSFYVEGVSEGTCGIYAYSQNGLFAYATINVEAEVQPEMVADFGGYRLEDIAKLNGKAASDLNITYNEDGYINFLGEKFTEMKINGPEDAEKALMYIADLLDTTGDYLEFLTKEYSEASGCTYYRFTPYEIIYDGKMTSVEYQSGQIVVIADSEGNAAGVSASIIHGTECLYKSFRKLVSKKAALRFVKNNLGDEFTLDESEEPYLGLYYDNSSSGIFTYGSYYDAWFIPVICERSDGEMIQSLAVVPRMKLEKSVAEFAKSHDYKVKNGIMLAEVLDECSITDIKTGRYPLCILDEYEPAGEYTYELDTTVFEKAGGASCTVDSITVSVPVMYDTKDKVYVLASRDDYVLAGNWYDFGIKNTINRVISKNPEKLDSWHFEIKKNKEKNTKYFFDSNYVVGSYYATVMAKRYLTGVIGIDAVDEYGTPILCGVYVLDGDEYPEEISDFPENMFCEGTKCGWMLVCSSPVEPASLEPMSVCHELTHGIQFRVADVIYENESGAICEAFADILAVLSTYIAGEDGVKKDWIFSEPYTIPIRNLKNPLASGYPDRIGGAYYCQEYEGTVSGSVCSDGGGVHSNCLMVSYLAYKLSQKKLVMDGEARLTYRENLLLWYESLQMCLRAHGFVDLGAELIASAKLLGLSSKKQAFVSRLVSESGFDIEAEDCATIAEEGERVITVTLDIDNSGLLEKYGFGLITYIKIAGGENWILTEAKQSEESDLLVAKTKLQSNDTAEHQLLFYKPESDFNNLLTLGDECTGDDITVYIKTINAKVGERIDVGGKIQATSTTIRELDSESYKNIKDRKLEFYEAGEYFVAHKVKGGKKNAYYVTYIIVTD